MSKSSSKIIKVVIAGGGSGGHIYPALGIAQGLVDEGLKKEEIIFFGSNRTLEKDLVPQAGYSLVVFPGRGLNRSEFIKNIYNVVLLVVAILNAVFQLVKNRPKLIIGVGGYASVPALIAGTFLRIPRVVHEQNSVIGRTNKLSVSLGAKLITTFEDTQEASESIHLGLPMGDQITTALRLRNEKIQKATSDKQVVISGGSLGSVLINKTVVKMVAKYKDEINFKLIHVCGKNNYAATEQMYKRKNCFEKVALHSYRDDLVDLYAVSDCVVSRAGAGTCIELETLAIPCVLVPLRSAPGDHQKKNASNLVKQGIGTIISEQELDEVRLFEAIKNSLDKKSSVKNESFHLGAKSRIAKYLISTFSLSNG